MARLGPPPSSANRGPFDGWLSRLHQAVTDLADLVDNRWTLTTERVGSTQNLPSRATLTVANASDGEVVLFLPTAAEARDQLLIVKKIDSTVNLVKVKAAGGELIDDAETIELGTQYESVSIVSDGRNWWAI